MWAGPSVGNFRVGQFKFVGPRRVAWCARLCGMLAVITMSTRSIFPFTVDYRETLRARLLSEAEADPQIVAAAITGSGAGGTEDRWSDIDLAFGVREGLELADVIAAWTTRMYEEQMYGARAAHHMDVIAGPWVYRVFLLSNALQVDLAFVPVTEFRALAPTFRVVFGAAQEARYSPGPDAAGMVGWGWLYALHARSSLMRGKWWQAEAMIRGVREQAMALASLRYGVPAAHAKGLDSLPAAKLAAFSGALVTGLQNEELWRALAVALGCLVREFEFVDRDLAKRLEEPLGLLGSRYSRVRVPGLGENQQGGYHGCSRRP